MNVITRAERRILESENRSWPTALRKIPHDQWPYGISTSMANPPVEAWRSRGFLVQVFREADGIERLSVCRTSIIGQKWQDNITWDELQRLKAECGRGDHMAVEIFPADRNVVNVANMRHLWVLTEPLPFGWSKS